MNWRIRLTWWDKTLLAIMVVAGIIAFVRFATGIGTVANINNAYPWGWWVGYGIMTMIAIGGVGFTITALVEIFGVHRYHSFLRPAVLMAFLCYASAITMLMVELGRPWMVWMVLVSWAPTSALYEVGWCAFLYLTVLALEFARVPLEQAGWSRAFRIVSAIYIPIMLLGVTLSHLHQSSLGTLMTLIPAQGESIVVVGSVAIALSIFRHDGRSGDGDHRASRRGALARLRSAHGSARRPRPNRGLARGALPCLSDGRSFLSRRRRRHVQRFVVGRFVLGRDCFRPDASLCSPDDAGSTRNAARARNRMYFGSRGRITAPAERGRDRLERAALGNLLPFIRRGRYHTRHYSGGLVRVRLVGAHPTDP